MLRKNFFNKKGWRDNMKNEDQRNIFERLLKRNILKKPKENRIRLNCFALGLVAISIIILLGMSDYNRRFNDETIINGVDCSYLTAKQAKKVLEEEFCKDISFTVVLPKTHQQEIEYKTYQVSKEQLATFEYQVSNTELLDATIKWQKQTSQKEFVLSHIFSINSDAVRDYLKTIPELNGENVIIPQDAYLKFNEEALLFEIVPEVYGNQIKYDLEGACDWAINCLLEGKKQVDFSAIIRIETEVMADSTFLREQQEKLNSILRLEINFRLVDGSIVTLDANTIKKWIELSEDGYSINIKDNLPSFIDHLAEEVEKSNSEFVFHATEIGEIILPIPEKVRARLDKEMQQEKLENLLNLSGELAFQKESETLERKDGKVILWLTPEYKVSPIQQMLNSYVELDITRQMLWLYINGECILITPVVTGDVAKGHETPTGIYFLYSKSKGVTLTDHKTYWSWVNYWMNFIPERGIGFHDANWRSLAQFVPTTYLENGSHGCVNLPTKDKNGVVVAKVLYENLTTDMPIIIYKS